MIHDIHVDNDAFMKIKEGTKTVELRLNDVKRRNLHVGEIIILENRTSKEKINVKIVGLKKYPSFKELYADFSPISLGYNEEETASYLDMEKYYSKEEILKYGVLAIEIVLIWLL